MPRTTTPTRHRRLFRVAAAFAVLTALAGYLAVQYVTGHQGPPRCTVRAADGGEGGSYGLSPEMAANAATISAVGTTRGLPERAVTIALATALQESSLRNIDHGDRDSLGLFQQRPSQGWGTPEQIMDPVYSAGEFYKHLAEVPGYSRLPLTEAAQRVQKSAFPQAYAKHEPDAALLAAALTGRAPASLTCSLPPASGDLPGDAAEVRADLVRSFGKDVLPAAGSAGASAATTVSVPVRSQVPAADDTDSRHGWELAHWAVARAGALRIAEVSYDGRVWRPDTGWRSQDKESGTASVRMRLAQ
ncbi:hypothetical protein OG909_21630 [Streptomyces sp. NBC_01754]|uniref:hypothetical protein n=1 Tax=Streptomyces sp. NBC_01754 TaxID=2975930 RepID=UPI002DDC0836|nr:hypothetical protein [Streptomyces sp. NBC_01754]WSC94666.1 hypothetical protein OG909_21630 [Streptomyces sp. NBC_01754]